MRSAVTVTILALSLSACATTGPDMSSWTPEQIYAYRQAEAAQYAATNQVIAQNNAQLAQRAAVPTMSTPTPTALGQPGANYVYCRSLGTYVLTCRD